MTTEFKYDVAFSFLKKDEAVAFELNDRIQDRMSTFIYSKAQEALGGSDGEKKFNEVFYQLSRVVVLLYREGWGQTPWTRIEETAIKNRAFDNGWEFLLVVDLEPSATLPKWIPKSYIWLDFQRFKVEGAIAVIDQKVRAEGGQPRDESISDKAERLKRQRVTARLRDEYLRSNQMLSDLENEIAIMRQYLAETRKLMEHLETGLTFKYTELRNESYEIEYRNICLNFYWYYNFPVREPNMVVTLYERPKWPATDTGGIIESCEYQYDQDVSKNNGWSIFGTRENLRSTVEVADEWSRKFMDQISLLK